MPIWLELGWLVHVIPTFFLDCYSQKYCWLPPPTMVDPWHCSSWFVVPSLVPAHHGHCHPVRLPRGSWAACGFGRWAISSRRFSNKGRDVWTWLMGNSFRPVGLWSHTLSHICHALIIYLSYSELVSWNCSVSGMLGRQPNQLTFVGAYWLNKQQICARAQQCNKSKERFKAPTATMLSHNHAPWSNHRCNTVGR